MKEKILKFIEICFVAGLALIVFAGLGRALFAPKEINWSENRPANILPGFTASSFMSAEYQDGVESALADQIHGAEMMKSQYNKRVTGLTLSVLTNFLHQDPEYPYAYNGILIVGGDRLLYYPKTLTDKVKAALAQRAEEINTLVQADPGPEYFLWFIEKETDINFRSGNHMGHYEYFSSLLDTSLMKIGVDTVDSYEDYCRRFYKTDHHWNHVGAYEGYVELMDFLGISEELISPEEEFLVGTGMTGSKATVTRSAGILTEDMYAYRFAFPELSISINAAPSEDYGYQNMAWPYSLTYGGYYGEDHGEIVFDTGREELDNILVIGDSYDNAILKLMAGHYNRTYSVDLRYYEHFLGEKFELSDYVEENDIDKVLIIGSVNFYSSEDFSMR